MELSPGACSIGCWKKTGFASMGFPLGHIGWSDERPGLGKRLCKRRGARRARSARWLLAARLGRSLVQPLPADAFGRAHGPLDLGFFSLFVTLDLAARLFSPYNLNPLGTNPLKEILSESIEFERIADVPIRLFVTATNVQTGRGRVFRNAEITPDVLLASACLTTFFRPSRSAASPIGRAAIPATRP